MKTQKGQTLGKLKSSHGEFYFVSNNINMWIKQASFAGLAFDPEYFGSSNPSRADEGKPLPAAPEAGQGAVHQDLCHGKTNAWVFAITKPMCNLGMYLPPPPPQDKKKEKLKKSYSCKPVKKIASSLLRLKWPVGL